MSSRVNQQAQVSAACMEMLSQELCIPLDTTIGLAQLSTQLNGDVTIGELRGFLAEPTVNTALMELAPGALGEVRDLLSLNGSTAAPITPEVKIALTDAIDIASATIAGAARDITADAFIYAAQDLGYSYSEHRGHTVTGIELRRQHELILILVHDDGTVQSDHAGLTDATCGSRQRELYDGVRRRGITLTDQRESFHGQATGGDLIRSAAVRQGETLAQAAVLDAEGLPRLVVKRRVFEHGRAQTGRRSRVQRRGGAA
jgi:hypothetical protein